MEEFRDAFNGIRFHHSSESRHGLIQEAKTVVERYAGETDNVRYQYACNAAMCCAMGGEYIRAEENVLLSRKVDG